MAATTTATTTAPTTFTTSERTSKELAGGYLLWMLSKGRTMATPAAATEKTAKPEVEREQQSSHAHANGHGHANANALSYPPALLVAPTHEQTPLFSSSASSLSTSSVVAAASTAPAAATHRRTVTGNINNSSTPVISHRIKVEEMEHFNFSQEDHAGLSDALRDVAADSHRLLQPLNTQLTSSTTATTTSSASSQNMKIEENLPRVCSPIPIEQLPTPSSDKIALPQWFLDSKTTVVIGKGHLPRKTPGNFFLRQMVKDRLNAYQESNRRGRAVIVSDIYTQLKHLNSRDHVENDHGDDYHRIPHQRCFGNFDSQTGEWCEAREQSARDKIAATFRDCLSHLYKSSTKSKVAKRRSRKAEKAKK